jgi:hypothetical protein
VLSWVWRVPVWALARLRWAVMLYTVRLMVRVRLMGLTRAVRWVRLVVVLAG